MSSKLSDAYQILAVAGTTTETADTYVSNEAIDLSLHVQAFSASTSSATILVQQSVDGTNWYTSYTFTNPTSTGEYVIGPIAPYNRLKLSAHASGTVSAIMTTTSNRQTEWKSITAQDSSSSAGGSNDQVQTNDSGSLSGSANLTFDETTLALTGNQTISGTLLVTGALTNTNLTTGRVPYASTGGLLTDEAAFAYNAGTNTLTAGTFSGAFDGSSVTSSALTATRVPYAGTAGLLKDEAAFNYTEGTNTLAAGVFSGTLLGGQQDAGSAISGDGAIAAKAGTYVITKGSALGSSTLAPPVITTDDYKILRFLSVGAYQHVISCASGDINGGTTTAVTFTSGAVGDSVTLMAYQAKWFIIASRGTISLS